MKFANKKALSILIIVLVTATIAALYWVLRSIIIPSAKITLFQLDLFNLLLLIVVSFLYLLFFLYQKNTQLNQIIKLHSQQQTHIHQLTLLSRVFTDTHEGMTITNNSGLIIHVNQAFCKITGFSSEDVIGKNPRILSSGNQPPEFYKAMWQTINEQGHWRGEVWNRRKDGGLFAEMLSVSALKDKQGEVTHYVGLLSDITHKKKQQEKLSLMAHYDSLTQLPNRSLFSDRFHQAIAHSKRTETHLAICFIDLDDFKPINDNFGHAAGDQLLIEVAKRITKNIRKEDTISRQGGDEFAMLLGDLDTYEQCEQTIKRIQKSLANPFIINTHSHSITASIGVTLYPENQGDMEALIRQADQAMYQAKLLGKHRYHWYNSEEKSQSHSPQQQLNEVSNGLKNSEFCLYYEPIIDMSNGDFFAFEASIRWAHPKKGLRDLLEFTSATSDRELAIQIDYWSIEEALKQLAFWKKQSIEILIQLKISIRLVAAEFFCQFLAESFAKYPSIKTENLQLEISPIGLQSNLDLASNNISNCHQQLGITFSLNYCSNEPISKEFNPKESVKSVKSQKPTPPLDAPRMPVKALPTNRVTRASPNILREPRDYLSFSCSTDFSRLKDLAITNVKIEKQPVKNILDHPSAQQLINETIQRAITFECPVIATGVQTNEQGLMLLLMGCQYAQGSSIARAMPANNVSAWLKNYQPNQDWLSYKNQYRNLKKSQVKMLALTNNQWQKRFVENIQASPKRIEHWPIMDNRNKHSSVWIKKARAEKLFSPQWLDKLEMAHERHHFIAHLLLLKHQNEDLKAARSALTSLSTAFDEITQLLEKALADTQ